MPPDRFSAGAYYHTDPAHHGTSNVVVGGGSYFLDDQRDIGAFDHGFFQIPPSEADVMDPQQRILLETVYDALCDAGLGVESLQGSSTSVFVGQMSDDWNILLNKDTENVATYTATGSARSSKFQVIEAIIREQGDVLHEQARHWLQSDKTSFS